MTTTTMIFTCLPRPDSDAARFTVLCTPRLTDGDGLAVCDYEPWGTPWPDVVASMRSLQVAVGGTAYRAHLAPPWRPSEALDAALWDAIVPCGLPVTPYSPRRDHRRVRSFPAAALADHLHGVYAGAIAGSSRDLPALYPAGPVSDLDTWIDELVQVADFMSEAGIWAGPTPTLGARAAAFYGANRFYRRRAPGEEPPALDLDDTPAAPEQEFHRLIALVCDHPTLMRRLGLAFDLTIDAPLSTLPAQGTLRASLDWRGATPLDVFPVTAYQIAGGRMFPCPNPSGDTDVDRGYLRLRDPGRFGVIQLDVDGAALQSLDFAASVRRQATDRTRPAPASTGLPTLRTDGLTIVRTGRGSWLDARRAAHAALETAATPALFADDVVRGYRIDVEESPGVWRSLCRRYGTIRAVDGGGFDIETENAEEGFVRAASGTSTAAGNELYLHEAIAGWDGWSVCARRPGRTVRFDKSAGETREAIDNRAGGAGSFEAEYQALPRSLPRLRYGRSYRLRARAVDVAGNSLAPTDAATAQASDPVTYRRYEPVAAPTLVQRTPTTEGESLERMVVRAGGETNDRHVVAPKGTLALAERHGMLDDAFTSDAAAADWYLVARKEAGTLIPTQEDATIVDLESRADVPMEDVVLCNPPSAPLGTEPPLLPARRGDSLPPGVYVLHTGDRVAMPWLPDPLSLGVSVWDPANDRIVGLPWIAQPVSWSSRLAQWPQLDSMRLVLRGRTDELVESTIETPDARTVLVTLAPGRMLTLRYSSPPDPARLDQLALWAQLDAARRGAIEDDVRSGRHWAFSPPRDVVLVHALQRPYVAPAFAGPPMTERGVGETALRFRSGMVDSRLSVHGWSTSHVDVRAGWTDLVDDGRDPAGARADRHSGDAFRVAVDYGATDVPCRLAAVAVERSIEPSPVPHTVDAPQGADREARHELADTRHRVVTYTPVGTTRYQEYFPAEVIADRTNLEAAGAGAAVNVLSSAAPPPPTVLYAVPTFGWEPVRGARGFSIGRKRVGNGLRIYLARPWFATGAGERLAVMVADSRWGADPVWSTPGPAVALAASHFRDPGDLIGYADGAFSGPRVVKNEAVVAYLPEWNADRQLWYVDVELDTGRSYWPFVSLSLARWQPDALATCELSQPVRLHYAQLAPDRVMTAVRQPDHVDVTLTGVTSGNALEALGTADRATVIHNGTIDAAHRVYARLECCAADPAANDLSWHPTGPTVELRGHLQANGDVQWSGSLQLTGAAQTQRTRVVLSEAEVHASDAPGTTVNLGLDSRHRPRIASARERVVYLDQYEV